MQTSSVRQPSSPVNGKSDVGSPRSSQLNSVKEDCCTSLREKIRAIWNCSCCTKNPYEKPLLPRPSDSTASGSTKV